MSPQTQRIAIAEACGWARTMLPEPFRGSCNANKGIVYCKWEHPTLRPVDNDPGHDPWHGQLVIPDYLNDLNAMHEAEKTLGTRSATYANVLEEVCRRDRGDLVSDGQKWHATAAQRAEAFLRTFDKWEGDHS